MDETEVTVRRVPVARLTRALVQRWLFGGSVSSNRNMWEITLVCDRT